MFKKIVVAVDGTDLGDLAFQEALAMAQANQSNLMLVHVMSPMNEAYPDPIFAAPGATGVYVGLHEEVMKVYTEQWEAFEQRGLDLLKNLTEMATAAGVPTEFTQALGDPGKAICNLAFEWDADLIVLGRRGLKGLSELFLGSVSNYVLHHAHCSVLTIQGAKAKAAE
ncbi:MULTISPECIES: universal stress protein [Cyanophyceae]|uniref:Universal stress protein n=1 Tax=Pseudocalidococcus azoricus BACA0444 TaxID=2918990 RepID=A0AAE4FRQ0_9CYAN|nr:MULTISPECIES: universal stress protein [Cyanophyceae]AFY59395.1 universal stress protein UspA-like protein [Synechococcus sp. PCC 6312]MDS3861049.1 universal stress protein [Pseudocalidococcus azoricus BACA0444]